jgi:hypothetical protein
VELQGTNGVPLTLTYLAQFTHPNPSTLDTNDQDFGSGGILIVPAGAPTTIVDGSTSAMFVTAVGKDGDLFVNGLSLGSSYIQSVNVGGDCHCGTSYFTGSDARGHLVTSAGTNLQLWTVSASGLSASTAVGVPAFVSEGFFTTISSNQTQSGSGVIWAVLGPDSKGNLFLDAYDPTSLTTLANLNAGTWPNGGAHVNTVPVVANGLVFVASYKALAIFGLGVTDAPVMTQGFTPQWYGFNGSIGSMNPTKTGNGHTYSTFADQYTIGRDGGLYIDTQFSVGGFTSDPGSKWLGSASAVGTTLKGAAASYSYSAGVATWKWVNRPIFTGSGNVSCVIVHQ